LPSLRYLSAKAACIAAPSGRTFLSMVNSEVCGACIDRHVSSFIPKRKKPAGITSV